VVCMMPATVETNGDLPAARRRLRYAVDALIEPQPHIISRDDGTHPITWLDSLLDQLYDAVSGQTGERSGGQSSVPVWTDVLEVIAELAAKAAEWLPEWPQPDISTDHPEPAVIARLKALRAKKWTVEDANKVNGIADTLEGFAKRSREKLNPEPVIYLMAPNTPGAAACTACGTDYVWRPDPGENNKRKRQPALRVTKDGCICQHCHASWQPGQLRILAAALGYPLPDGVLE
jgi:hypothetical protein